MSGKKDLSTMQMVLLLAFTPPGWIVFGALGFFILAIVDSITGSDTLSKVKDFFSR